MLDISRCYTDSTDRAIEDLPAFWLLLPNSSKGPLWRLVVLFITRFTLNTKYTNTLMSFTVHIFKVHALCVRSNRSPVWIVRAAVAVILLLPPPVPVNQFTEVRCLLAVFDDKLVLQELLGCGTLQEETIGRVYSLILSECNIKDIQCHSQRRGGTRTCSSTRGQQSETDKVKGRLNVNGFIYNPLLKTTESHINSLELLVHQCTVGLPFYWCSWLRNLVNGAQIWGWTPIRVTRLTVFHFWRCMPGDMVTNAAATTL